MRHSKLLTSIAVAASMLATPAFAQATAASKLSISQNIAKSGRAGTVVRKNASDMGGGKGTIIAILAAAAVIVGIVVAASSSKSP